MKNCCSMAFGSLYKPSSKIVLISCQRKHETRFKFGTIDVTARSREGSRPTLAKITAREIAELERLRQAFDAGCDYYVAHPDELMASVHRYASATYALKEEAMEFARGYSTARQQHDDYVR